MKYILALDQGTTSSRALLFDPQGCVVRAAQYEFPQHYPQPGWVEHDPVDILNSTLRAARDVTGGLPKASIAGVGITNQRETTVVWAAKTGQPVHHAIVWQCRRTAPLCQELEARGLGAAIRETTGLCADAYFSGTKIAWLLDTVPGVRERAEAGELRFGTVDTWLLWHLTGGKVHATDHTNASRTILYNLHTGDWDDRMLRELNIPRSLLPAIRDSSGFFGDTEFGPVLAMAGDQHAALFGQACFSPGEAKNTYGTGCFLLQNTGAEVKPSHSGLLTTVAWRKDGRTEYALEGSVFSAGSAVQWLRDELGIINTAAESGGLALSVPDTGGVYMVPAFTGLGAPHWDMNARGAFLGLTRGTAKAHLCRAVLESICYQTADILRAMERDTGLPLPSLAVDGGASQNPFIAQFQADLLGVPVIRPRCVESTALGAAMMAGLAAGLWRDSRALRRLKGDGSVFEPRMSRDQAEALYAGWLKAVGRVRS
jgi:glycerol kinase